MTNYDVVVIGGGPAGMSAALSAYNNGSKVLLIERDVRLGGILNQCIHLGFGLHYFGEEMTGPEYADRFNKLIANSQIDVKLNSLVLDMDENNNISYLSQEGLIKVQAKSIVLAMGCRERSAGAIQLTGSRPAGIYTAGLAQKLCNIDGYLVGKKVVVLGSGDIGLIMARRMTLEGAKVELVCEIMPYSSGLKRNIVQCLDDFDIPILYSHTITRVVGNPRLIGLYYAPLDRNRKPDLSKEKYIECDTLLLSVGLIPENDLICDFGIEMSFITSGSTVDENLMTTREGFFACGNVLHVHDLVDNVSIEADIAGKSASEYAKNVQIGSNEVFKVSATDGVRYALPQRINKGSGKVKLFFRVADFKKNCTLIVECGHKVLKKKKFMVLAPGEMESIIIDKEQIDSDIIVRLL